MTFFKNIIFLFFFVSNAILFAQDLKFDHITANDGLGDNFVGRIIEDSYGFIWIGTKDGLSVYDGYDVKTYKTDSKNERSLQSGNIGAMVEDTNGDLWLGTGSGIAHYRRKSDDFERIALNEKFNDGIYGLVLDSNFIWLSTWDGLCKLNKQTHEFQCMTHINVTLAYDNLNSKTSGMTKGHDGYLWFGFSFRPGLVRYNMKTDEFTFYKTDIKNNPMMDNRVAVLYSLTDSTMLVGFRNGGLYLFNVNAEKFSPVNSTYDLTEVGIKSPWVIYQSRDGYVWVGALNAGLYRFTPDLKKSDNYVPSKSDQYSLNSKSVSAIVEDRNGNLWFGTHSGGVNVIYKRNMLFRHYWSTGKDNALSSDYVSGFYENEKGIVWIGTDGGGVNVFDVKKQTFKHFDVSNGLSSNAVLSVTPYNKDTMIVTTWEGGVALVDVHDFSSVFLKYEENNSNSISFMHVKYTFRHGDSLYIVTNGEGINVYNIKRKEFYHAENTPELAYLIKTRSGNKAMMDSLGNLWVTANYGFFRVYNGMAKLYSPDADDKHAITGSYATDMYIDSRGRFWVATLNGLNLYDRKNDNFNYDSIPPILQNSIMSIIEDDFGNLWMGTNIGIIKYNPETKEHVMYSESDGLQGNQFFERSVFKDSEGYLYFGGVNGFNRFHPDDIGKDTSLPVIFFKDFKLFNKSQIPNAENSVLHKHINFVDEVVLDFSHKIFTIDFVAIHMFASKKNKCKYRLKGFDDNWYDAGESRSVTYTNLSPGKYVFEVLASNADAYWTSQSRNVRIVVTPPWWMTWWFLVFVVIFIVGIIGLFFYLRINRVNKINMILEEKVKIRTAELEESQEELTETIHTKDRFFSIIAHDLKNPMNSLIGFSDLLIKNWNNYDSHKKYKFITMINSSSTHLYNLLINLLEWSRAQTGNIKVNKELIDLSVLISENIDLLKGQADKKDVGFVFTPQDDMIAFADRNMINTVIRNLLSNSIKYSHRNSNITIQFLHAKESRVEIVISDTGVGIPADKIDTLFSVKKNHSTLGTEKEKGTGLGLIVCQEFVDINNGFIRVESELGQGTTFIISLPENFY